MKQITWLFIAMMVITVMASCKRRYENYPEDVDCSRVRTYIIVGGFAPNELKSVRLYEYKKKTDFKELLREMNLTAYDPSENYTAFDDYNDSLSVNADWLLIVNDTISYKITDQVAGPKAHPAVMFTRWVSEIKSFKVNGIEHEIHRIGVSKREGEIIKQ